jgi:hypothetical protein
MNFFSPLTAHDFPAFDIIPNALASGDIAFIYNSIVADLPPAHPKQSGSVLTRLNKLYALLRPLEDTISRKFGRRMFLRLDKSSYRTQLPSGEGALALHQDYIPLQELLLKRFRRSTHYRTDPAKEPCCTVWVPLVDIDDFTPTLEVSPLAPAYFVPHRADDAGYLIASHPMEFEGQPLVAMTRLAAGTGVFLTSLTLHRSCVRPWHTRTRTSFDLRFLPRPDPARWKIGMPRPGAQA